MSNSPQATPADIIGQSAITQLYRAGFVVVPIKPTERMLQNAYAVRVNGKIAGTMAKWQAMLASSQNLSR